MKSPAPLACLVLCAYRLSQGGIVAADSPRKASALERITAVNESSTTAAWTMVSSSYTTSTATETSPTVTTSTTTATSQTPTVTSVTTTPSQTITGTTVTSATTSTSSTTTTSATTSTSTTTSTSATSTTSSSTTATTSTSSTSSTTFTSSTSSSTTATTSTSTLTTATSATGTRTTGTQTESTTSGTTTTTSTSTATTSTSTSTSTTATGSTTTVTTSTTSSSTTTTTGSATTTSATTTTTSSSTSTSTTTTSHTVTSGTETSSTTTRTKIILISGSLQLEVDDVGAFAGDTVAEQALGQVIAGLFEAPPENTTVAFQRLRRLSSSLRVGGATRRLLQGLVDVQFVCIMPQAPYDTDLKMIEHKFDELTRSEVRRLIDTQLARDVGPGIYSVDVTRLPDCKAAVVTPAQLTSTPPPALGSAGDLSAPDSSAPLPWAYIGGSAAGGTLLLFGLAAFWLFARRRKSAGRKKARSAQLDPEGLPAWNMEQLGREIAKEPFKGKPLESLPALQELLREYSLVKPWPQHKQGGQSIIASATHRGSLAPSLLKIAPQKDVERERSVAARLQRLGQQMVRDSKITQDARAFVAALKDSRVSPEGSQYPFGLLSLDEGSGTLNDVLKSASAGAITNDMKRPVLTNCANVVAFLHECGIGWGDCAPSNFVAFKVTSLMGDLFQYRAIDFGSAALLPDVEGTEEEESTLPRYYSPDDAVQVGFCAPERLAAIHNRERIPADDSMDVWALGCIAFFVLAGTPLMGETEEDCAANLLACRGTGLNTEYMVNPGLQSYIEEQLDMHSKRIPLRALTELRKMLSVDPTCRPTAAQLIAGTYFGMDKSISMTRSIIRRFDDIQTTIEKFDPPVPDIIRVEVSPKNMARQTVTLVFGCADGHEFRAEVSDWRWWFRVAQQMSAAGKAVFCLIGGDLSGVDSMASMAGSAQTWAEASCSTFMACMTGGGNKLDGIQDFHSALHGKNIMDTKKDMDSGKEAMQSLFKSWKEPGDTTSFDDLMSQSVKISTQTDRVKLALRQSGFYDNYYYDVRRQGGGAWVPKDPALLPLGTQTAIGSDAPRHTSMSAPALVGGRRRANTAGAVKSPKRSPNDSPRTAPPSRSITTPQLGEQRRSQPSSGSIGGRYNGERRRLDWPSADDRHNWRADGRSREPQPRGGAYPRISEDSGMSEEPYGDEERRHHSRHGGISAREVHLEEEEEEYSEQAEGHERWDETRDDSYRPHPQQRPIQRNGAYDSSRRQLVYDAEPPRERSRPRQRSDTR